MALGYGLWVCVCLRVGVGVYYIPNERGASFGHGLEYRGQFVTAPGFPVQINIVKSFFASPTMDEVVFATTFIDEWKCTMAHWLLYIHQHHNIVMVGPLKWPMANLSIINIIKLTGLLPQLFLFIYCSAFSIPSSATSPMDYHNLFRPQRARKEVLLNWKWLHKYLNMVWTKQNGVHSLLNGMRCQR